MGVIHLVAPTAKLLPLKAFSANGSGSLSNILAAIYFAVQNHANVINMSFDLTSSSTELTNAINYANSKNVILRRLFRQRWQARNGLSRGAAERDGRCFDQ